MGLVFYEHSRHRTCRKLARKCGGFNMAGVSDAIGYIKH
jgi:hypothetical protein